MRVLCTAAIKMEAAATRHGISSGIEIYNRVLAAIVIMAENKSPSRDGGGFLLLRLIFG
jgi:hypothetical protein